MEVNKVGVNYNQLVIKFNTQKPYGPDDYNWKDIRHMMTAIFTCKGIKAQLLSIYDNSRYIIN